MTIIWLQSLGSYLNIWFESVHFQFWGSFRVEIWGEQCRNHSSFIQRHCFTSDPNASLSKYAWTACSASFLHDEERENYICRSESEMSRIFIFTHIGSTVPTQNIQGALVVGDDDIRSLRLQLLPTAHFKSKTQEILHMTNHEADNPEGKKVN